MRIRISFTYNFVDQPSASEYTDPMILGDQIRIRREQLGFSQVDFAKEIGVSQANLSRMERGLQKDSRRIGAIAARLKCKVTDLDPDFMMPSDSSGEMLEPLSNKAASLLSDIAKRMQDDLGFLPTDEQVIRHLIAKTQYNDVGSKP